MSTEKTKKYFSFFHTRGEEEKVKRITHKITKGRIVSLSQNWQVEGEDTRE